MSTLLTKYWRRYFDFWLERRLPRVSQITLNHRSIFTFPSRTGLGFLGVLVLMWLLATNYENNVVFVFAALLAAVFVVTIFHSFANLSGIRVRIVHIEDGFPGEKVRVDVEVSQQDRRYRDGIWLKFAGSSPQPVLFSSSHSVDDEQRTAVVGLYIDTKRRGKLYPGRLTVETVYPLGLIRVWSRVLLDSWGIVYPQPISANGEHKGGGESTDFAIDEVQGAEDFSALSPYRAGEPYNRIAWKQLARGQGLYTKHFADPVADPQWLDWNQYPGLDREARLSRLCADVLQAAISGRPYGLKLPGEQSVLGQGEKHRQRLLRSLALFEWGGS
ncbi:MAG: DUF58 domain-containing protein [Porticoccaceae bacterium]